MKKNGFTIVELMIVIVVIAILAGIAIFGYASWRSSTIETALSSDLSSAASAMKQELNFNNTYPTTIPKSYRGSTGISVKWVSSSKFCIEAEKSNIKMRWLSTEGKAERASCPTTP